MTEEKTVEQIPLMKALFGGRRENILLGIFGSGLLLFIVNALLISFEVVDAVPFKYLVGLGGLIMIVVLVILPFVLYQRMIGK